MRIQSIFIYLWLLLSLLSFTGCSYYSKVEYLRDANSEEDEMLITKSIFRGLAKDQYIVLRNDAQMWHLFDMKLSKDQKSFTANREKVTHAYQQVIDGLKNSKSTLYDNSKKEFINQVHFYVNDYQFDEKVELVTISFDDILKLEIYQHDEKVSKRTTTAFVVIVSPVASAAGILAAAFILCNCPYVYTDTGGALAFQGNLFSGSFYKSIERADYLPLLKMSDLGKQVNITIANEKKEQLYINQLKLISIEHDTGSRILLDQNGNHYSITKPIPPKRAISFNTFDHTQDLLNADQLIYDFGDTKIHPVSKLSEIEIVFDKEMGAAQGKLVLKMKNNDWGGLIYEEVSKKLGRQYSWFHKKEAKRSKSDMSAAMARQGMMVSISIFDNGLWRKVDQIWPIGSESYREMVIPIDMRNIQGDEIKIKLEGGFQFWDLDQALFDQSENIALEIIETSPQTLKTNGLEEGIYALIENDDYYYSMLEQGESFDIKFDLPQDSNGKMYSHFLMGKGYYSIDKEYDHMMKVTELLKFRRPGGFSNYSFKRFNEIAKSIEYIN